MPKPQEREGMPQHQQCSLAKHREDMNPNYHEEQHEDFVRIIAAHPPKTVGRPPAAQRRRPWWGLRWASPHLPVMGA
jgi:hypothetical protein